jgi:hypothetical protein
MRTQADGLAIQWVLADAEALPLADDRLKRAHNCTEGEPITVALAVGRDLRIWRFAQRFLVVPW